MLWLKEIKIIQGGMGVNISGFGLAREVSSLGCLGTVSGVAVWTVMARILQSGDPGGHFRMALSHFPFQEWARRIISEYFLEKGLPENGKFKPVPIWSFNPSRFLIALSVAGSFCFVWLAKHNNEGASRDFPISINYLEKIQMPLIFSIFGAMLAGVDCVTMGAGIPMQVPGILDKFANGQSVEYRVDVEGLPGGQIISFNPREFFGKEIPQIKRPAFLPIISSNLLAEVFCGRRVTGSSQGFVIENDHAGGHNAPPRGKPIVLNKQGEPVYGQKDKVDLSQMKELGLPFWLGGAMASPEALNQAISDGANGIQVGTAFALCEESGMKRDIKSELRRRGVRSELQVLASMKVSPTGFPFNVAQIEGTLSDPKVYEKRERVCDLCCLRAPYFRSDHTIGYRCKAERLEEYKKKGGKQEDTENACCLCHGLLSTCGFGGTIEPPVVTLGRNVDFLPKLMKCEDDSYTAKKVVDYLLGKNESG
jgi:NAD(P)H-dependent flavin oxidoreductase YrpB (nitropropane dioxygenase family)